MINNRQNGRRRGRGGGQPQRQGGGGQGQRDSGNRIDSRARGNAPQLLEKYKNMARDAQMAGDRVNTEYYLQFADHYFRVIADQRGRSDDQPVRRQRDDFDQFDDMDDFGDEGEPIRAEEQNRASEVDQAARRDRNRDDRPRDDRPRDDRQRDDRQRDDRPRDDRNRDDRPRGDDREDRQRDDRARDDRQREDRPRADRQRDDRPREDRRPAPIAAERAVAPPVAAADQNDVPPVAATSEEEAPRRRRARKPREESVENDTPSALDADRLPPALNIAPDADAGEDAAPKPRRRRIRSAVESATAE